MFEYFDWETESTKLNPDVIEARAPENRGSTLELIKSFGRNASRLSQDDLETMTPSTRELAAYACAHSAWILVADRQVAEAQNYLKFAQKFATADQTLALGYIEYVRSAVDRGEGLFIAAMTAGLNAVKYFRKAPEGNACIIAHAYIQAGLAALRLGQNQEAKKHFEQAQTMANTAATAVSETTLAHHFIMTSEGGVSERNLMNLAQVYNKLGEYEAALNCFKVEITKPLSPLVIAYRNNVQAEAYIGLQQYDEAESLLKVAYSNYKAQNALQSPNCLRTLLGFLEIEQGRNESLEHLEETVKLHAMVVGDNPKHDFTIRLEEAQTEAYLGLATIGL